VLQKYASRLAFAHDVFVQNFPEIAPGPAMQSAKHQFMLAHGITATAAFDPIGGVRHLLKTKAAVR
jgi:hypothetical protein